MLSSAPRSVRVLVQLLLLAIVLGAIYLYVPAVGEVTPAALQYSLSRDVGGATDVELQCSERRKGVWSCPVHDPSVAGSSVPYELKRGGRRCWDAVQSRPGGNHLDPSGSGCVVVRDQVRLDQRF